MKTPGNAPELLFFAQVFPPTVGGTPTMLRQLVGSLPAGSVAVISQADASRPGEAPQGFPHLRLARPNRLVRKFDPGFLSLIPWVAWRASRLAERRRLRAVVAVFPGTCFLVAGWLLARLWRLPLYVYFNDTWGENRPPGLERWLASRLESRLVRDAEKVFCVSDLLTEFLAAKHPGARIVTLLHAVTVEPPPAEPPPPRWHRPGEALIVYTGQVYSFTLDPLLRLQEALRALPDLKLRFLISTPDPPHRLERQGLRPDARTQIVFVETTAELHQLQREADILFNSVAFADVAPAQLATLFPSKTIEYLAAGRPMLIHSPPRAGFTAYARRHDLGEVVDQPDPQLLAAAIRRLLAEPDRPAWAEARRRELARRGADRIAAAFRAHLGLGPQPAEEPAP